MGAFLQGDGPVGGEKIACFVQIPMKILKFQKLSFLFQSGFFEVSKISS